MVESTTKFQVLGFSCKELHDLQLDNCSVNWRNLMEYLPR